MAECGTDEGEDSGLTFEEWLAQRNATLQIEIDPELDEILGRDPLPQSDLPCLQCGRLVTEEFSDTWVWVQNPAGPPPMFVPFCNSMHRDIYFKQGVWAEHKPIGLPALRLDED